MSVLERLKKLDEERSKLIETAKAEAMAKAEAAIVELNDLGFDFQLTEAGAPKKTSGGKTGITRQRDPTKPCGICEYVTVPPHDGRAHKNRSQKPFTTKELDELGFKRVSAATA